jgi:4-amino-4-deoxy-L-arabinose transferase-like glycosyltransferase
MTAEETLAPGLAAPSPVPWWRTPALLAAAVLLLGSAAARLPRLAAPPLGLHDFRQTQTAITVQAWLDRGFTVLHYETPVFGPPWQAPFELPTYQASAYVLAKAGIPLDLACRLAALLWFYASAILLFVLARRFTSDAAAVVALAMYVSSPFSLRWSRAFLIDYASVTLALGWLLATASWAKRPRLPMAVAAATLGVLAAATKITTVPVVVPALVLVAVGALRRAWRNGAGFAQAGLALAAIGGLPLAAGALWTRWADAIKAAAPATAWLISPALSGWTFGTLEQRLSQPHWLIILLRMDWIVPGKLAVLPAVAVIAVARRNGSAWASTAAALGALLPVLTFFNLYWVHDYYLIAITPCLALLVGIGAAELLTLRIPWRTAVLGAASVAALWSARESFEYARTAFADVRKEPVVALADVVAHVTPRDGWVVIEGDDWNPRIPYLSHRRGFMIRPPFVPVDLVAGRPEVATLVCAECREELLARWPARVLAARQAGFSVYRVNGPGAVPEEGRRLDSNRAIP